MFRKLIQTLKTLNAEAPPFDPASLNDSVALQTKWTPKQPGGTNICTHRLIQQNPYRIEFKATTGAKLFSAVFLLIGLGILNPERYPAHYDS